MHILSTKITLGSVQNECCVVKPLWRPCRMKKCARSPTALSRAGRERTETRVWRGTAGHRRASSLEPCDDLDAHYEFEIVLDLPRSPRGPQEVQRKREAGSHLRVIAGLHPRNPAMSYTYALISEITLGFLQNASCGCITTLGFL